MSAEQLTCNGRWWNHIGCIDAWCPKHGSRKEGIDYHWGASPSHGGLTQHVGPFARCTAPDCMDANRPQRDERGRFLSFPSVRPSEPTT